VPLVNNKFQEKFSDNEMKILDEIRKKPEITQIELVKLVGISRRSITKNINKLKEKKAITRIGSDRKGYWQINKNDNIK